MNDEGLVGSWKLEVGSWKSRLENTRAV